MRIVLIGPPASGKGTISKWMQGDLKLPIISTGAILQRMSTAEGPAGEAMRVFLASGNLMDDGRITEILFTNLPKEDGWLLDGYPRTVQQAELLDRRLYESGNEVDLAIFLDVPKDSIRERIAASGRTFSDSFNPPRQRGIDDITGEPLVRRYDDEITTLERRFLNFEAHRDGLLAHYTRKGIALIVTGRDSPALLRSIQRHLNAQTLKVSVVK